MIKKIFLLKKFAKEGINIKNLSKKEDILWFLNPKFPFNSLWFLIPSILIVSIIYIGFFYQKNLLYFWGIPIYIGEKLIMIFFYKTFKKNLVEWKKSKFFLENRKKLFNALCIKSL